MNITTEYAVSVEDIYTREEWEDRLYAEMAWEWMAEKEMKKFLRKYPKISVKSIKFLEVDSSNYSHAVAYFTVVLSGPKRELRKVAGPEEVFYRNRNV